jgi:hypothetical protein
MCIMGVTDFALIGKADLPLKHLGLTTIGIVEPAADLLRNE